MEHEIKTMINETERIPVTDEFIKKYRLNLGKTQEEIVSKMDSSDDVFGDITEVLFKYLDYENVKNYLNQDKLEEAEKNWKPIVDLKECVQDFLDYMVFAWGKAESERGLSASRSIQKLSAWMWLLGRDDLRRLLSDDCLYNPYGAPALIKCCEELDINVPESLIEFSKHKC